MSATILWQPDVPNHGRNLEVGAPSSFLEMMAEAFGRGPWTLDRSSLEIIRGLLIASQDRCAWTELKKAIEDHGQIRVWAEY